MSIAPPEVYNRVILENARLRALNAELVDRWSARAAQVADLRALNAELVAILEDLRWRSIDKDNMEFECRATYCVMDKIRAAIAKAKGEL